MKVHGLTRRRATSSTCNGRALPLQPTGTHGEFVAGVRYRAWQPPSCLHPTIPVHAPLVFDIVDTWTGRSRRRLPLPRRASRRPRYETFPVNALEAERRRLARFEPFGHTPGPMTPFNPGPNPSFPHTLDLRRINF